MGMTTMNNWKKNIILFMTGQGLSLFGSMLVYYAILWHITLTLQSGVMMMVLTIAGALPMFFISPFGGVWADRYNKKLLINISDASIAAVTLIMAILFLTGHDSVVFLLVCSVIRSLGQGVQTPAVNALIPEIVPTENLTKVNGLNGSLQSMIMMFSPMVAGVLIALFPITLLLFIDVITATIGIIILYFFVKTEHKPVDDSKVTYFSDLKEGIKYVAKNKFIKKMLILTAIFNVVMAPTATLTPLQVTRDFGPEVWRLTVVEMVFFAGSILGGLVIGVWGGFKNKSHTMGLSSFGAGIFIAFLGILGNFWFYIACMGIAGIFLTMFNPPMMTVLQTKVDANYMGRVFALMMMVSSAIMPVAMILWGPLSDVIKIDWILLGTGIIIFLMGLVFVIDKTLLEAGIIDLPKTESEVGL